MSITVVTTFKIDHAEARRLSGKAAEIMKRHGATHVRLGFCHAGAHAGTSSVVVTFADWAAYGRAAEAFYKDSAYQSILAETAKSGGVLLDRSIMVMQDL